MSNPHLENTNAADRDLLILLGQYFAQLLYAQQTALEMKAPYKRADSGVDRVVPLGTVLVDGVVKLYARAAILLLDCSFARKEQDAYVLLCASDRFGVDCPLAPQRPVQDLLREALHLKGLIYEDYEKLGPPDTLIAIFDALLAGRYTEMRFGHLEWADKALEIVYPRRLAGKPLPERDVLWKTDLFDWYLNEAAQQWPARAKT